MLLQNQKIDTQNTVEAWPNLFRKANYIFLENGK